MADLDAGPLVQSRDIEATPVDGLKLTLKLLDSKDADTALLNAPE